MLRSILAGCTGRSSDGFFWSKLGRDRVIVVSEEGVEICSDFQDMLRVLFIGNWKDELYKENKTIYQKYGEN